MKLRIIRPRIIPRRKIRVQKFSQQWQDLQKLCRSKETWPQAIILADKLLYSALKKRRFRGKTTGEKLVAAQKSLTNNDAVWQSHNLAKKLEADAEMKLQENDVKTALLGFGQALRDLGVFPAPVARTEDKL
ncbi:hypothetical protein KA068_02565 [Candidatus Saccharibacteria bacterium]|jgi:hypothetical protein|nr:hypothetical protein [Candidatus Saccharibacteria bacterium]